MAEKNSDKKLSSHFKTLRVLVVDDSGFDREILRSILFSLGITQVQTAENGQVARHKLLNAIAFKSPFDLVLTDWKMPTQDGRSLLKWMRGEPRLKHMYIMVVTGSSEKESVQDFIAGGVNDFIVKPITQETLTAKLEHYISKRFKDVA